MAAAARRRPHERSAPDAGARPRGLGGNGLASAIDGSAEVAADSGWPGFFGPDPRRARPPFERAPSPPDRETMRSLLRALDPSLGDATFDAAWNEAGATDDARGQAMVDFLARALPEVPAGDIAALTAYASAPGHQVTFRRLAGMSGSAIADLAQHDAGARQALGGMDRWALTGNRTLANARDPDGRFDRFDPDTGERNLSDSWIDDRARFLAWRDAQARGVALASGAAAGWRFVDRADETATIELSGSVGGTMHQVIFARDGGDRVDGGATTDRIHGGTGDDDLRGAAGDDLLDGGRGADALAGGRGRDWLDGGTGDDALDGGAGRDLLQGGAGDDDLEGGRGDDRLEGGSGADTYRFESGDGGDTIVDSDGGGSVVIDDAAVSGTMARDGDRWVSGDGAYAFTLDGDAQHGGTLSITSLGEDGAPSGDTIRVEGWRQGALGISLAEEPTFPAEDWSTARAFSDASQVDAPADDAGVAAAAADALDEDAPPTVDSSTDGVATTPTEEDVDAWFAGTHDASASHDARPVSIAHVADALSAWDGPAPPDVPPMPGQGRIPDPWPTVDASANDVPAGLEHAPAASDVAIAVAEGGVDAAEDLPPIPSPFHTGSSPRPPDWTDALAAHDPPAGALHRTRMI